MSKDGEHAYTGRQLTRIGAVLRADVDGQIMMRAYLSGTPECKFGLNDKLVLQKRSVANSNFGSSKLIRCSNGADAGPRSEDAVELDDCQFHQCVRLGKFDSDRSISFIPPDGEFELMRSANLNSPTEEADRFHRYRSTSNINLPFRLQTHVTEPTKSRVEYTIHLRASYDPKLNANNVVLKIPTPLNTTNVQSKVGVGKAKYVPGENFIIWK